MRETYSLEIVPRVAPVRRAQAELDVVVLVEEGIVEARDLLVPADHQPEGGGDLLDVDPEVGRPLPIDLDPQLGPVETERRGEVEHAADLDGALAQLLAEGRQRGELGPADDVVDVEVAAADVEPRDVPDGDADVAELAEALPDLLHHLALGVVAAEGRARIPAPEPFPEPASA